MSTGEFNGVVHVVGRLLVLPKSRGGREQRYLEGHIALLNLRVVIKDSSTLMLRLHQQHEIGYVTGGQP